MDQGSGNGSARRVGGAASAAVAIEGDPIRCITSRRLRTRRAIVPVEVRHRDTALTGEGRGGTNIAGIEIGKRRLARVDLIVRTHVRLAARRMAGRASVIAKTERMPCRSVPDHVAGDPQIVVAAIRCRRTRSRRAGLKRAGDLKMLPLAAFAVRIEDNVVHDEDVLVRNAHEVVAIIDGRRAPRAGGEARLALRALRGHIRRIATARAEAGFEHVTAPPDAIHACSTQSARCSRR